MIFGVTNYLELCNAMIVYCAYRFFSTNHGRIGCLDTVEQWHLYLVKKGIVIVKIYKNM